MIDFTRHPAINETLSLILRSSSGLENPTSTEPLDELFHTLKHAEHSNQRSEAEDLIWALWCSHESKSAYKQLQQIIGYISRHEFETACEHLNDLIEAWPQWAEPWNKRATVWFLLEDDDASVADIQRTLALEPRHFGAICGFGQICLRANDNDSALIAFESALALNPNLTNIGEAVASLQTRIQRVLH